MAEIAVNLVIDKLMIPLLRYEVTLLRQVRYQVESIKNQLSLIKAYLRDADVKAEKEEKSDVVKEWVKQVREVAHRIEDVIDEYLLQVAQRRQSCGIVVVLEKIAWLLRSIEPRHVIVSKIDEINKEITALDRKREALGFITSSAESCSHGDGNKGDSSSGAGHDLQRGTLFLEDAKLEGINDTRKKLKNLLLDEDCRRMIIGVVGTGGLGKENGVHTLFCNT